MNQDHFFEAMAALGPFEEASSFAVAVSGGADSLALTLLMDTWCQAHGHSLKALTVDHGLRIESSQEALQVHQWLQTSSIEHHILTWAPPQPLTSRLQEKARQARYQLLQEWCYKNQIPYLLTAHHAQDQAETILMRLSKGSGLKGLSGIPAKSHLPSLTLLRPLLTFSPHFLRTYLAQKTHPFIEDPSNQNLSFERVRWRKVVPALEAAGLTLKGIQKTVQRLEEISHFLDQEQEKLFKQLVVWKNPSQVALDYKNLQPLHPYQVKSLLAYILKRLGNHPYSPRYQKVERLYQALFQRGRKHHTLGGCHLYLKKATLWIEVEHRKHKGKPEF